MERRVKWYQRQHLPAAKGYPQALASSAYPEWLKPGVHLLVVAPPMRSEAAANALVDALRGFGSSRTSGRCG